MRTLKVGGPMVLLTVLLVLGFTSWAGSSPSAAVAPEDAGMVGKLSGNAGPAATSDLRSDSQAYLPVVATSKLYLGASYIVYTDGTTIYALNGKTGAIDFQGPDAAAVIRSTLAEDRRVIITAGKYMITSPIDLVSHLRLELEDAAILEVPNGYDSYVFGLAGAGPPKFGVHHTHIEGGTIREECSDRYPWPPNPLLPKRLWTGILLYVEHDGHGVAFNTVRDIDIWDAGTAIKLLVRDTCQSACWINSNGFFSMHINDPMVFIDFAVEEDVPDWQASFDSNYFENIMGSVGQAETTFGVKDLQGFGNTFVNVCFWDIHHSVNSISARILPFAKETIILGGLMTQWNFQDNGIRTQIIDRSLDRQIFVDELTIGHPPGTPGYRIWAQEDGLYLEYVSTHKFYRLVMEEITAPSTAGLGPATEGLRSTASQPTPGMLAGGE